jgi:hypothetical protein
MEIDGEIFEENRDLYFQGERLFREKKYWGALECAEKLVAASPDNYNAQFLFGMAKMMTGDIFGAIINLCQAEELLTLCRPPPENKAKLKKAVIFNRALCLYLSGDDKKAAKMLLEQAEQKDDPLFQSALGFFQAQNWEKAIEILIEQAAQETGE